MPADVQPDTIIPHLRVQLERRPCNVKFEQMAFLHGYANYQTWCHKCQPLICWLHTSPTLCLLQSMHTKYTASTVHMSTDHTPKQQGNASKFSYNMWPFSGGVFPGSSAASFLVVLWLDGGVVTGTLGLSSSAVLLPGVPRGCRPAWT